MQMFSLCGWRIGRKTKQNKYSSCVILISIVAIMKTCNIQRKEEGTNGSNIARLNCEKRVAARSAHVEIEDLGRWV